jgi:hypothetical protein
MKKVSSELETFKNDFEQLISHLKEQKTEVLLYLCLRLSHAFSSIVREDESSAGEKKCKEEDEGT